VPILVADAENYAVANASQWMALCGMNTTAGGANPSLAVPIAAAVRALGEPVAAGLTPADADLAAFGDDRADLFLNVVYLYTLRACMGHWGKVDTTISMGSQKLDQLFQQLKAAYEMLAADLLARYGFGRRRRRNPKAGAVIRGTTWPPPPPPPATAGPWPEGYDGGTVPAVGPNLLDWGFNP
jgi:hypothetical protein